MCTFVLRSYRSSIWSFVSRHVQMIYCTVRVFRYWLWNWWILSYENIFCRLKRRIIQEHLIMICWILVNQVNVSLDYFFNLPLQLGPHGYNVNRMQSLAGLQNIHNYFLWGWFPTGTVSRLLARIRTQSTSSLTSDIRSGCLYSLPWYYYW